MESLKSRKALDLLNQLRNCIDEQEKTIYQQQTQITNLKHEVEYLTKANEELHEKLEKLESTLATNNGSKKRHRCRNSSNKHVKTSTDHQSENGSVDGLLSKRRDLSASLERSGSFQRNHLEEQDMRLRKIDGYELSADIRDKQLEVLRKHYGGAEKCEHAARVIQQAYRKYQMQVSFEKIRKSKSRRLTIDKLNYSIPQDTNEEKKIVENGNENHSGIELEQTFPEVKQVTSFTETEELLEEKQLSKDQIETNCDLQNNTVIEETISTADEVTTIGAPMHNEVMNLITPVTNHNKANWKKKRHVYEPVSVGSTLPATPEHETTSSVTGNECHPQSVNPALLLSRNSDGDVGGRRLSPAYHRTPSEMSLSSFDMDADGESLRSSDTGSINSEMLSNSGDGLPTNYIRKNSVRSAWNVEILNDVERRRLYRIGLNLFNMKPSRGISFLIDNGFIGSSVPDVARFLYNRNGLSRQMVGEYLGNTQKVFNQEVLDSVCTLMNFSDMEIDEALRMFQADIRVQGEAQKVERLTEAFSQRYCTCNPSIVARLQTPDSIFVLAFAIIMLNTDLHSPNMKHEKRMTEQDFIRNLRGVDNGKDLDENMLKNIYNGIKARELITKDDHLSQVLKVENCVIGKKPVLSVPHRRLISRCRLYQVHDLTKPQKVGLHQREVFLFNDIILVTKLLQKKKQGTTYTFKQSITLYGLGCYLFDSAYYSHGIRLHSTLDNKVIITFNAPNESDKTRFVNDVKESIAEVQLMETLRIGAELERAQSNSPSEVGSHKLSADTKKLSTSMQNLNASRLSPLNVFNTKRPSSVFGMPALNENNNSHTDNLLKPGESGSSAQKEGHRASVFGTFFTSTSRRNQAKRAPRSVGDTIPFIAPNGDSPGVTLTLHKVHEV